MALTKVTNLLISGSTINLLDYGVTGNGTDETVAIQSAITAACAEKRTLYIPSGTYKYTTLTIDDEISVIGDGNGSNLQTTQVANGGITVTTRWPVTFERMILSADGTPTSGALLTLNASVFETGLATFRNVVFSNYYIGLRFLRAATWNIYDCYFESAGLDAGSTSLWIQNDQNPDSGDSSCIGNVFYYSNNIGTHIRQISSGGTKIIGNKFLYGESHYRMVLAAGASTYDLIFANNSSEFAADGNMIFDAGTGGTWANVQISNNQYTITSGKYGILVNISGVATWLDGLNINGNIFGSTGAATAIAINNTRRVSIDTNSYRMEPGSTGINIGANTNGVDIKPQSFNNNNLTYPISGNISAANVSICNSSGVNFSLASGENIVILLENSLANSVASVTIGGTVATVGTVTGQYIAAGASTVTTLQAITNVALNNNATSLQIVNSTGQVFTGKILVSY